MLNIVINITLCCCSFSDSEPHVREEQTRMPRVFNAPAGNRGVQQVGGTASPRKGIPGSEDGSTPPGDQNFTTPLETSPVPTLISITSPSGSPQTTAMPTTVLPRPSPQPKPRKEGRLNSIVLTIIITMKRQ